MPKNTVLICDDNPAIAMGLSGYLEQEGMSVINVTNGEDALEKFQHEKIDAAILDIMLPGVSGLEVCREIKNDLNIPVLLISAKSEEIDKIIGLEIGADDYITKPFSPKEVAVRTRKLLRLYGRLEDNDVKVLKTGKLEIYPDSYEVKVDGKEVKLTTKEFKILLYLASHAGKVRSRDQIINAVWGMEFAGESRIVDTLVKRIRRKLQEPEESEPGISITTVFGVGYKLEEKDEK